MTDVPIPAESIARVDLLLGQATMITAGRWDGVAGAIHEAMGIALLMAASHPTNTSRALPGLALLDVEGCVDLALREVQTWDLGLAAGLPDAARLRAVLTDLHRDLTVTAGS